MERERVLYFLCGDQCLGFQKQGHDLPTNHHHQSLPRHIPHTYSSEDRDREKSSWLLEIEHGGLRVLQW